MSTYSVTPNTQNNELFKKASYDPFTVFSELSYADQGSIYLLKNTVKTSIFCPLLRVCVHGVCVCGCVCVCVFTAVCVHFGWVIYRVQILSMCHHTWLHVMSLSLSYLFNSIGYISFLNY